MAVAACPAAWGGTPEQQAYWWLDELRTVAFGLSTARTGKVARWPRTVVPAGSGALPLPHATGPMAAEERLDPDEAWTHATTCPVGPIFGPWTEGPFHLQVSVCSDDKALYLRIDSPHDLTDLGSPAPPHALFLVGDKPFRVGKGGDVPADAVRTRGKTQTVEVALNTARLSGKLALTFFPEVARCPEGKLPPEMASLGLNRLGRGRRSRRGTALWLSPITIGLFPSTHAVRITVGTKGLKVQTATREAPGKPASVPLAPGRDGVSPFSWAGTVGGKAAKFGGFAYAEPVQATLAAVGAIAERIPTGAPAALLQDVARLEAAVRAASPQAREPWRKLFCEARTLRAKAHLALLDAPLLFTKRHPYYAGHIYDDYYTWHPGGGIYVLENPHDPAPGRKVRAIIDPDTKPTLGAGVYRDPQLSWDASRILFACKATRGDWTSIYEIRVDGTGLRRLTNPKGYHDITPNYLPDGRIVFTSTRPKALVPCFNSGVDTLHVMNADGSGIRSISSNNVTEFDPVALPDGRILYGRWEYLDKTALYMQSLWTMFPDGTHENALFANNQARPTAVLDARPVPGTRLVVASLTPHNGQAVGAIGMIDTSTDKNSLDGITNFTPEYPKAMDQGLANGPSDPWPLSPDDVLMSNNAVGGHGIIELVDRWGHRELAHCDPAISVCAPRLVKPQPRPNPLPLVAADDRPGRFLVLDVYQGLTGVPRGAVTRLRVVEETARISGIPPGGRWWNQAFLMSWQGAYVVKNFLGTVPVHPDGSAYFEAPPGRALYLEALDADGRELHRMRTFIQAVPGATRTCIGCHEHKFATPPNTSKPPIALLQPPAAPEPESWGSGFVDYPTMIQPILDRHCVNCHGGQDGIAGGIDLSGGWTWAFNISYETLLKHNLVGFVRCNNGDVTSSVVLPPRTIGSGAAPLGDLLVSGHDAQIPKLSRGERDLVMAWMDGNSNYFGTWDYTKHATCNAILTTAPALAAPMKAAGCAKCHDPNHVGNDWVNLQHPEWSRILRAPMAKAKGGLGLAWCRQRKAPRGLPLVTQRHLPPDVFRPPNWPKPNPEGEPVVSFAAADNPHYQAMLAVIRQARADALTTPRVDMAGAQITPGVCRLQVPMPLPTPLPPLAATLGADSVVQLSWPRTAATIGLEFEVHRGTSPDFAPSEETRLAELRGFRIEDKLAPPGQCHYALVCISCSQRSRPVRTSIRVPPPVPPQPPTALAAAPGPGQVGLQWTAPEGAGLRYHVLRSKPGDAKPQKVTDEPLGGTAWFDTDVVPATRYTYAVTAVSRRGAESTPSAPAAAAPLPESKEPVLDAPFAKGFDAKVIGGTVKGKHHGAAKLAEGALDLRAGGHVTFPHRPEFDLRRRLSVELWVRFDQAGTMPVPVSCGRWNGTGWFLQRYNNAWRWHVGGVDCDGGKPAVGRWLHVVCTFDGRTARVFQDGVQVASKACRPNRSPWPGPLFVGQYGAGPTAGFQVNGRIRGLRIYQRAVPGEEAAAAFKAGKKK